MTRFISLVLLCACAPTQYRLGVRAAENGQYFDASQIWLGALDEDIYATKPRSALIEYAPTAYQARLDLAREHEASGRFAEGAAAYESLFAFEKDLEEVELLTFRTADTRVEHKSLLENWANTEFRKAVEADAARQWATAIEHFAKVRELQPTYPGLDEKEGFTYLLWAEEDLHYHRYVDASTHYRESFRLTGHRETEAWAAAVDAALGRYALEQGFCREANERFEAAGNIPGDVSLDGLRAQAADCARVAVVVQPLPEDVGLPPEYAALGTTLVDRLERAVDTEGSRYVHLYAADMLASAEGAPAKQFRVEGRMTQVDVEPEAVNESKQTTEGQWMVECDKETLIYEPDAICTQPVEVEYTLKRTAQIVRMAGSVKTVNLTSGEQTTRPLSILLTSDSRQATGFQVYVDGGWVPVNVGAEADVGRVGLSEDVLVLDRPAQPLPAVSETLSHAVDLLAEEAGSAVLEAVDAQPVMPAPTKLDIRPPKMLPDDLDFEVVAPPIEQPRMEAVLLSDETRVLNEKTRRSMADLDAAFRLNEEALASDPENPEALSLKGLIAARLGMGKEGEAMIREVLVKHPKQARAWADLGLVLKGQDQPVEAEQALKKARDLGLVDVEVELAIRELSKETP